MIIAPYKDKRRQPTVVVVDGDGESLRYMTDNGFSETGPAETLWARLAEKERYKRPKSHRTGQYMATVTGAPPVVVTPGRGSIRDLVRTCDARHWEGLRSAPGKYKALVHDGGPVVKRLGLRTDYESAAHGLFEFVEFCNGYGVRFNGSVPTAGYSLFRTTLDKPFTLWSPPNIMKAMWPGRRESFYPPTRYYDMAYFDLPCAYGNVLDDKVPTRWGHYDTRKVDDTTIDGYGLGAVYIPNDNPVPNPLPLRLKPGSKRESISYATGAFEGIWPFRDLAHAQDRNQMLRDPTDCWVPTRYTDAFATDKWQLLRKEMRNLPGIAGDLGKLADNSLWGMFAFDNTQNSRVRWLTRNGDPNQVTITSAPGIRMIHGMAVGVTATARVRAKLYDAIVQSDAVYCETDGVIASRQNNLNGDWKLKQQFGVIDIKAPQIYRWLDRDDVGWHYHGESTPHTFLSTSPSNSPIGDGFGNAGAMSIRDAHLRRLIHD